MDTLALYFAAMLIHIRCKLWRLVLGALIGGAVSVIYVLSPEIVLSKALIATLGLVPIVAVACPGRQARIIVKFTTSFIIFSALLGAFVNFLWGIFDSVVRDYLTELSGGGVNRRLLLIAIAVLLSIGVFKMIVAVFSGTVASGKAEVTISYGEREITVSALIDSGNLALDPMDMQPILLIKEEIASKIFDERFWEYTDPDILDQKTRRRIRLIPISAYGKTRVLVGVKADSVKVTRNNCKENINVTVAIDKEGGTFGGFDALLPATALCDAEK